MRCDRLVRVLLATVVAGGTQAHTDIALTVGKLGGDVHLSWTGGIGPHDVIRSCSPRMSASTSVLASNVAGSAFTDVGAATDAVALYTYVVSDVPGKPSLNIGTPCDTPPGGPVCSVNTTQRTVDVNGTTGASIVYVNEVQAAIGAGTFSAPGTPLYLESNTITAAAKGTEDNWSVDQVVVLRETGNQPPNIEITLSDRGAPAVPAAGATIHDPTPQIIINYDDDDDIPPGTIDPTDLRVFVNGTDKTASFTATATQATYQVPSGEAWSAGTNFVVASVQDGGVGSSGFSSGASAHIRLSAPTITSFAPAAEGAWGAPITIHGAGFDPVPANNVVSFAGVGAAVSAATPTTLNVTVPPGAQTGNVTVKLDGRSSNGKGFTVVMAAGRQAISSIAVNPAVSSHVFFTDKGTNDNLYEILGDGSVVARCALAEPTGLPVDSAGRLYFGNATTPGALGPVQRYVPAGTSCASYVNTRIAGETTASVVGAALTDVGGMVTLYTADADNGKIKRVDPGLAVSSIGSGHVFANPAGMAVNAARTVLYYSSMDSVRSVPIPGGGAATVVRSAVGGPRGLAITSDDKLVIARTAPGANAVSWYDPQSSTNPFWDLATGFPNPPGPQAVALGTDGGAPYVVVAEATRVYRIPKPSVVLTDDADQLLPEKLVVDFPVPTPDCKAANTVTLKVRFTPPTLIPDLAPPHRVTWTVEDPDDPSPDSQVDPVDPTGPSPDNLVALGSYTQWEMVPGFAMTGAATASSVQTDVTGGVSKVTFHPSCQPGDNYRFKVSVAVPIYGNIEATSDVVTVWRKLHIEHDSMGVAIGPFDFEDAVMEDVPGLPFDLMAAAYEPAYIEVVLPPDGGFETTDVRFQYNVPNEVQPVLAQTGLGRGATSTEGRWIVYIQAAYEGDVNNDNDPDPEAMTWGVTVNPYASLSYLETMRDSSVGTLDNRYVVLQNVVHEIGHQFGLPDAGGCIMSGNLITPLFCPGHLRTMRMSLVPGAPVP